MDDLIRRRAAIDALRDYLVEKRCPDDGTLTCRLIENEVINKLPSAQPDPCEDAVSRKAVLSMIDTYMNKSVELHYLPTSDGIKKLISILPSVQPERKTVLNRDIAIEAICDEVMLWFDISATQAYEIAETAVKRIEVRMEKTERGEQE